MDIFCKIINGEIPGYTIYEDEIVKCFLDIDPISNGHTLIIPKKHFTDINDIDMETLNHIFEIDKMLVKRISERLHTDGIRHMQNNGCVQDVKHFHLHIIPIYCDNQDIKDVKEMYELLK